MAGLLVLGTGYIGAAAAEQALVAGEAVTLADDWSTTDRWQVNGLESDGASVHTVDIRNRAAVLDHQIPPTHLHRRPHLLLQRPA